MHRLWRSLGLDAWLDDLFEVLLPRACAGCRRRLAGPEPLCAACASRLPRLPARGCRLCQVPVLGPRCAACAAEGGSLAACVAEAAFAGAAVDWVRRFKYPRAGLAGLDPGPEAVAVWLVRAAARRLPPGPSPERVVPVPLHPQRLRARGFHPAGILARAVADVLGVRADATLLRRVRDTPSQTGLGRAERRRNVAGAFRLRTGASSPRRVCLVDDVVTTGSTLREAARVLRRAGARRVVAVCVARTPAVD